MDKKIITGNFSRNAASYDDHAAVQKSCAEKLIGLAGKRGVTRILEIGCGTGNYTRILRDAYARADITAIDIAEDMVNLARGKFPEGDVHFKVADGEQTVFNGRFDLITSNASFQWFEDLEKAIAIFSRVLVDGGMLCFSMYGPETFREFKEVLGAHFRRRSVDLSSSGFASRSRMENILKKHFKKFEISEECFNVAFFSLWDFLRNVKCSGTRGEGLGGKIFLGKYAIKEMEKTYVEKFGGIFATHHVYFCRAQT
jgi:malonyl-CoA O-methyltransferase